MKRILYIAPLIAISLVSCGGGDRYVKSEGMIWNTLYHITYQGEPTLCDSVAKVLDKVGKSLSVFDTTSLVSRVNRDSVTEVDSDFIKVYRMSERINALSGGKFDPTLSPLITAWGFGKGHEVSADTAAIDSIRKFVGFNLTSLTDDGRIVKKDPRVQFNFSAIAKGYGCDAIGEMLLRNGVENFLIEIGGEIYAHGVNPEGGKWRVSVEKPDFNASLNEGSVGVIEISDRGVATSGNYRNFHESGGKYFGHTIDAATGRPAETDVISATVVAGSAMEADGLATAFMAMGSESAKKLIEKESLPAMLVLSDSTVWTSSRFQFEGELKDKK